MKELRTTIPSSALRAPSPHAWGEEKENSLEECIKFTILVLASEEKVLYYTFRINIQAIN
jgi:hypothetical protein